LTHVLIYMTCGFVAWSSVSKCFMWGTYWSCIRWARSRDSCHTGPFQ